MNRHYYISEDLDDLETVESELEANGISTEQIHVLSEKDADVEHHHLHDVPSFMKQDVVHSGEIGAAIGAVLAAVVLGGAYLLGWTESAAGWVPFIFLAIVLFGFCTWEGGFFGIQVPNAHFRHFRQKLKEGKHVFFVDVEPEQESILDRVVQHHPALVDAGTGAASPHWIVAWQQKWHQFKRTI
ncbi:magnesium transporter [Pseudomonas benzenivorans]|uniref:Magnesium transporter n=1 Tax=Pseudomonas benzenivorans TaxID=556533 RepID=A0ABY5HAY5_9PSED|nr:magnesium transporter [Pseudomonas benzenivorans]UTW08539.1 magnesium transporter [Pseudomonas benzenivorans]